MSSNFANWGNQAAMATRKEVKRSKTRKIGGPDLAHRLAGLATCW